MSELSQVLQAIGGLQAGVETLNDTVGKQGEAIQGMTVEFAQIKTHCVLHRQQTEKLEDIIFGEKGDDGLVKLVGNGSGRLDRMETERKGVISKLWAVLIPLIIAGIIAAMGFAKYAWAKMNAPQ